jgi:hypothetical protein
MPIPITFLLPVAGKPARTNGADHGTAAESVPLIVPS